MIRCFALNDGALVEGGPELVGKPDLAWIDVEAQTADELELLRAAYDLHPLAIEDCLNLDQRPKAEDFDSGLFVVLHSFTLSKECEPELHELHTFVTDGVFISVHEDPLPSVTTLTQRVRREPQNLKRRPDALLYVLADLVVDTHMPLIDEIHDRIDDLESEVLEKPTSETLETIFRLKRALVRMRRTLAPSRDVFLFCAKGIDRRISETTALYFRDVYDHAVRNTESIDAAREILTDVLSTYLSATANRTNEIMKRLTLFSAVFLPLGVITGFFGMNFTHMPFDNDLFLGAAVGAMVIIPATMVAWFYVSRWVAH